MCVRGATYVTRQQFRAGPSTSLLLCYTLMALCFPPHPCGIPAAASPVSAYSPGPGHADWLGSNPKPRPLPPCPLSLQGPCSSLRRHKLDVDVVGVNTECGVALADGEFSDFQTGDVVQCMVRVSKRASIGAGVGAGEGAGAGAASAFSMSAPQHTHTHHSHSAR